MLTSNGLGRFRLANTSFATGFSTGDSTSTSFRLHRSAEAIQDFPRLRPLLRFRNVLQLTTDDVGSAALTSLVGTPAKLVVVSTVSPPVDALLEFAAMRGLEDQLSIYTDVDVDRVRLLDIVDSEFGAGGVEVVLDDVSADLDTGRTVFDMFFPGLPPDGSHVIERWARDHFLIEGFVSDVDPAEAEARRAEAVERTVGLRGEVLEAILSKLVVAQTARPDVVASITASKHWLAVRRGTGDASGFAI